MTADLLREAAALMRERAEAATPGPWMPWRGPGGWEQWVMRDEVTVTGPQTTQPDAKHIASWHPAVALAVADWLDAEADDRAARVYLDPMDDALSDGAVAVARAYLGRDVVTSEAREAKR